MFCQKAPHWPEVACVLGSCSTLPSDLTFHVASTSWRLPVWIGLRLLSLSLPRITHLSLRGRHQTHEG